MKPNNHEIGRTFVTAFDVVDAIDTELEPLAEQLHVDIDRSINEIMSLLLRQIELGRIDMEDEHSVIPYGTAIRIDRILLRVREQLQEHAIIWQIWKERQR